MQAAYQSVRGEVGGEMRSYHWEYQRYLLRGLGLGHMIGADILDNLNTQIFGGIRYSLMIVKIYLLCPTETIRTEDRLSICNCDVHIMLRNC